MKKIKEEKKENRLHLKYIRFDVVVGSTYSFPCRHMHRTVEACPYSTWVHSPVSAFHTRSVRSVLPLTTVEPAIWQDHTPPEWPTSVIKHCNDNKKIDGKNHSKDCTESEPTDTPISN
jgi:hypothetical protein